MQSTWIYNTSTKTFSSAIVSTENTNSNTTASSILLTASSLNPTIGQYVGLSVKIYNNYGNVDTTFTDQVRFNVSKMDNYGSYYTANSNDYYISNNRYTFSSSDYGYANLLNYLQFYTNGTYKVRVENIVNATTSEITIIV
jgi:hypothetical protein